MKIISYKFLIFGNMEGISRFAFFLVLQVVLVLMIQESCKDLIKKVDGFSDNILHGSSSSAINDNRHFLKSSTSSRVRRRLANDNVIASSAPPRSPQPASGTSFGDQRVYHATAYGADPTGETDSTDALVKAIHDAFQGISTGNNGQMPVLMPGITDLGGSQVNLDGGMYRISRPLRFPASGGGNVLIHGGTLRASNDFPTDGYLIELPPNASTCGYEDISFRDLMLDANYRGGGISIVNSLRTTVDNCYITHFMTDGVLVKGGHETLIHNSFIGQHITAGGDPDEKNFSGVGINLASNDNAVTDVVIFSAQIGILISGQANTISGVHCYNKATGWGGTGIYIRLPGLTQTRIINCYMDYTGIVAEDPVQLHISSSFFLGSGFILLRSVNGVISGVNIVDNMFMGTGPGGAQDIVQLDESKKPFTAIDQVVVDRNNVKDMHIKTTQAEGMASKNGTSSWMLDFSKVLLFPNFISYVQYTFQTDGAFPNHALRNVSKNMVVVASDTPVSATVYVSVKQTMFSVSE